MISIKPCVTRRIETPPAVARGLLLEGTEEYLVLKVLDMPTMAAFAEKKRLTK